MKIVLFGGCFDPVNNYHIAIANEAAQKIGANMVIFIPSYYDKNGCITIASPQQRYHMCKLAMPKTINPQWIVSDCEIRSETFNNSYNTLEHLWNYYGIEHDYFWLLGSDNLVSFPDWFNAAKIKSMAQLICYVHPDYLPEQRSFFSNHSIIYLNEFEFKRTNHEIQLTPIKADLNFDVFNYINTYGIYGSNRIKKNSNMHLYQHAKTVSCLATKIASIVAQETLKHDHHASQILINQATVAGLYHDFAKNFPESMQKNIAINELKITKWPSWKVIHGPVAAWWMKKHLFFTDQTVLRAVAEHTLPANKQAPIVSKIVFLADHIQKTNQTDSELNEQYFWTLINNQKWEQAFNEMYDMFAKKHNSLTNKFIFPLKY